MNIKLILTSLISILSLSSQAKSNNTTNELPFVISVCAYNNARWVQKNLDSIFMQDYTNFRVVYIDDASTDTTANLVQEYIDTYQLHDKMTLLVNPNRCRKMKNIYNLFHSCADEEIIIQIDGDDWLAHDKVFKRVNQTYQNEGTWLTYGQFLGRDNKTNMCRAVPSNVIKNRSFRSWDWVYTHLRTFRAWLFKNIKLEDFIGENTLAYSGKFLPVANDAASMFPMLEMCGNKFSYIPDVLYIYNWTNPNLGIKVESNLYQPTIQDIKNRPKYPQVTQPIIGRLTCYKHASADLIILSNNNLENVQILLNSVKDRMTGIQDIYVLYEERPNLECYYKELEKAYSCVQCIPITNNSVRKLLNNVIQNSKQEHIVISQGTAYNVDSCNINECIMELERTFAYGFYLGFAHDTLPFFSSETKKELFPFEHIYQDLYAWKFRCGKIGICNNLDMTLLRKKTILERVAQLPDRGTMDSIIKAWQQAKHANIHNVGLFYGNAKVKPTPT